MYKRDGEHKYNAKKTMIDGISFSSKLEANAYLYFKENDIKIVELQPKFQLNNKFEYEGVKYREIRYVSDFLLQIGDIKVIVDMKGMVLPEYKLKKKLFLYKITDFEKDFNIKLKFIEAKSLKDLKEQLLNLKN